MAYSCLGCKKRDTCVEICQKIKKYLQRKKIKKLVISGVFGDGCVHATMQGAFSAGYNMIILKDLIETTDIKDRQRLQKLLVKIIWPNMFGKTLTSTEFLRMKK